MESLHFDFGIIRVATDNFSDANKLGRVGFGEVYWVGKYHDMIFYFYIIYEHAYRVGCLMDKR